MTLKTFMGKLFDFFIRVIKFLAEQNQEVRVRGGDLEFTVSRPTSVSFSKGKTVITTTNDHQDEPYNISLITEVKDAEGEIVPVASVVETFESSAPDVVQIVTDAPGEIHAGHLHFGHSGAATLTYQVQVNGQPVKVINKSFVITTGQVASVVGGDISIPGLPEDPE